MGSRFRSCGKVTIPTLFVVCLTLVTVQLLINLVNVEVVYKSVRGSASISSSSILLQQMFSGNATVNPNSTNLCPRVPPNLVGALATDREILSFDMLHMKYPELKAGGRYKPADCIARHRVAIVIPYRDRETHLKILLNNLHPLLERQQLDYAIYVVEQAPNSTFNRGLLMNIGYVEAIKDYNFKCFIFHDVDLIPENDRNLYTCSENPRHMSVAIDKFNYELKYLTLFGGVSAMSREHMEKVNGFSNIYFGWGGEDDDMSKRINHMKLEIVRPPIKIARYKMIKHESDATNSKNNQRFKMLKRSVKRMKTDGLNSLKYDLLKKEYRPLYTWVYAAVNQTEMSWIIYLACPSEDTHVVNCLRGILEVGVMKKTKDSADSLLVVRNFKYSAQRKCSFCGEGYKGYGGSTDGGVFIKHRL